MVDYHILEQFVTFYQTGTLRETAEKMHISQPTLTRNMQRLKQNSMFRCFTAPKTVFHLMKPEPSQQKMPKCY